MQAKSISGQSVQAIQESLEKLLADAASPGEKSFKPTMAFVFLSVSQDRKALAALLTSKGIDMVGATTSGEFTDGHQSKGGIAILLLDLPRTEYQVYFEPTIGRDINEVAKQVADASMAQFAEPVYLLCSTSFTASGSIYDGRQLVRGLEAACGRQVEIFGGMAGADGTLGATYVFTADGETDEGFVLLALNGHSVAVTGTAVSGWKPLGRIRTVTKAEGEWLYEIDGQPALDMYLRYLGQALEETIDDGAIPFMEDIGFFHPFLALDDGEPMLRTPMEVNREKHAIRLDFVVTEGRHLQFTLPPDFDIVETVLAHATAIRQQHDQDADALLVFSCLGRLSALGPMTAQENEGLHDIWHAPMAGFYTYGEYGRDPENKHLFHSTTCSWVALKST